MAELSIAELLDQSRAAHQRYREASAAMVPDGAGGVVRRTGSPSLARTALHDAAVLRQRAEAADPTHADPAWADEPPTFDHRALTAFYAQEVARPA